MTPRAFYLALLISLVCASQTSARIRVIVNWMYHETEIYPERGDHQSRVGTFIELGPSGDVSDNNGVVTRLQETTKGVSKTFGIKFGTSVSIRNGKLEKNIHVGGTNVRVTVSTDGISSCSADVSYYKSPGKRYFEAAQEGTLRKLTLERQYADDVQCTISKE